MSFIVSMQAEVLKTKRTASFWLSIIAAIFVPTIFSLIFAFNPSDDALRGLATQPWQKIFFLGWEVFSAFALPMYVILISTLIPQIEIRNNTWKQVFASPQSIGNIFFSKFVAVQVMILACFLLFNAFLILAGILANLVNQKFPFLHNNIDVIMLFRLNVKMYISLLGISAIQYFLSLRFKNFIVPIGIGLALVIAGIVGLNLHWQQIFKYPYAFPLLTSNFMKKTGRPFLENHEWNSIGYFAFFMLLGFFDMKMRKEKG